jgi:hypothetical protein
MRVGATVPTAGSGVTAANFGKGVPDTSTGCVCDKPGTEAGLSEVLAIAMMAANATTAAPMPPITHPEIERLRTGLDATV